MLLLRCAMMVELSDGRGLLDTPVGENVVAEMYVFVPPS
jgi:hypothetical protein